ncbi:MAG: bifunctional phosphopantothenoylcysteine decarboxylase/phosphopantothenate--cysteine ligase CoaBC, partial [Actinomycetota bacterium]|nr:bifunctional phosphopantothenoylcysteine decarboxylase/phosphopantothenate--cysteine ligase CoaBC [Actinomycetota bacterium]
MGKVKADVSNKNILLVVSGGISAYKAVELARLLVKGGANVKVIMTEAGERFVSSLTFRTVTGNPVVVSMWAEPSSPFPHISLSRDADLIVVAPATANILAKMTCGIADDLATTTLLSARCPIVVAPAMNLRMYSNFATQRNLRILAENGVIFAGPEEGELACGEEGAGRMCEPPQILEVIKREISLIENLSQKTIMVTAGPTREYVDPVRFISNPSSGRMGFAVADRAARRGAKVYLVSGPVDLPVPPGTIVSRVTTAEDIKREVMDKLDEVDALVMAAAVSDFKPSFSEAKKIKKGGGVPKLELEPAEDILKLV